MNSQYFGLRSRYPSYIPAIVVADKNIELSKLKYLMPVDVNFGLVMTQIRKNAKNIKPSEAIIFVINGKIASPNTMVRELECGDFVNIRMMKESTFG